MQLLFHEDFLLDDYRIIATIPWFSRRAVLADVESGFAALEHYEWDEEFFWGVRVDALSSRVWRDVFAVDEAYLSLRGSFYNKLIQFVSEVFKGLSSLPHRSLKETWMTTCGDIERTANRRTFQICALFR